MADARPSAPADIAAARGRAQAPAQAISNGMVGLLSRYTGRGPTRARTAINSNFVLVSFHDTLTRAEHNLVAAGQPEAVWTFHEAMADEATAIVEGALGRAVTAFLSDVNPEADTAVMVFMLERVPENGLVENGDARVDQAESSSVRAPNVS
jgi:uncharacterized protein YbcI